MIKGTTLDSLDYAWHQSFGDLPPDGPDLKWKLKDRWLRIHTLPYSKRYPETEAEYSEILHRHNKVLDLEVGRGNRFYLVVPGGDEMIDPVSPADIDVEGLSLEFWRTTKKEVDEAETFYEHYFFRESDWSSKSLDAVLRKVVDDELYGVILFCPSKKFLYHPYDGGADLIFETFVKRDAALIRYAGWFSPRADGL
jgi:hypothetical protein